ncbi:MAG: PAS domain-containing protein, partial [Aquihabitans sp.]
MTDAFKPQELPGPSTDDRPLDAAFDALRQRRPETFLALLRDAELDSTTPPIFAHFEDALWIAPDGHPISWVDPTWHATVHNAWLTATTSRGRVARTTMRTHRPLTTVDGQVEIPIGWFELTLIDLTGVAGFDELMILLHHLPAGPADADTATDDVEQTTSDVSSDAAWFRGTSNFRLRLDAAGRIAGGTLNVAEVLGRSVADLVGTSATQLIHVDDTDSVREAWQELVQGGGSRKGRCRLQTTSGAWRWFEVTCWNLIDAPSYGTIIGEFRDIHEQAEAEIESDATSRSLERLLQMLDQIGDLVIVGRVGAGIMYLNNIASAHLGRAKTGARLLDVLHPTTATFVMEQVLPTMLRSEQWIGDIAITLADHPDPDRIF